MNLRVRINFNWFASPHGTAFQNIVPIFVSCFPSFGCGFDSHRPLHNSRCFNCPYTANLTESNLKMDRFGPRWTLLDSIGPQRFAEETGQSFDGLLSVGLDQRDLPVEIWFFLRMELERDAAHRRDALQHCERVPGVLSVLEAGNHRLRGANLLGEFRLSQPRNLPHLAHQQGQINLVQGAPEGLTVGCALAGALFDNFTVFVSLHSPSSFEEQPSENPVELLNPQLEYVTRELLYELPLHPVAVDTQALDKRVYAGGSLVIQRIDEVSGRCPPVR
jgi:hypothetical protein